MLAFCVKVKVVAAAESGGSGSDDHHFSSLIIINNITYVFEIETNFHGRNWRDVLVAILVALSTPEPFSA